MSLCAKRVTSRSPARDPPDDWPSERDHIPTRAPLRASNPGQNSARFPDGDSHAIKTPNVLTRLQIDSEAWRQLTTGFEMEFSQLIGTEQFVQHACDRLGQRWAKGASRCRALFAP